MRDPDSTLLYSPEALCVARLAGFLDLAVSGALPEALPSVSSE